MPRNSSGARTSTRGESAAPKDKPRVTTTPAQRAQSRLDAIAARLAKAKEKRDRLRAEAEELAPAIAKDEERLAYAKADPDLPPPLAPEGDA